LYDDPNKSTGNPYEGSIRQFQTDPLAALCPLTIEMTARSLPVIPSNSEFTLCSISSSVEIMNLDFSSMWILFLPIRSSMDEDRSGLGIKDDYSAARLWHCIVLKWWAKDRW
jgi:hypothetical protein